jgi:Spy/CpxP family protein refolding chaperone
MKPLTKKILFALGGVGLITSVAAYGHHQCHDPEQRANWMIEKISDELELTEPQVTKLEGVRDQMMQTRQQMHQARSGARADMLQLIEQPRLDREQSLAMINQRLDALRDQAPQLINALGDFYDSLTPEQQQELRERIEQRMARFEARHSH